MNSEKSPTFIVSIGNSGSGKTTFLKELMPKLEPEANRVEYLSADRLREQLTGEEINHAADAYVWWMIQWHIEYTKADYVIIDVTNANPTHRQELLNRCRQRGQVIGLNFTTPTETCLERQQNRQRQVPTAAITRMGEDLKNNPPTAEEGFSALFNL